MNVSPDLGCSAPRLLLHARLSGELSDDEFVVAIRGTCTRSEFVAAIAMQINAEPHSMSRVMALINRLNHRGDIPPDLVMLLNTRISSGEQLSAAQTLSHPNVVKVYDVDRDGDVDFFTMELLEGELLSSLIRRFQPLPLPRAHA